MRPKEEGMPAVRSVHRARFAALVAALSLSLGAASVLAQDSAPYPSRTITLIVPYTPGTGADILSRVLGPKLAERWKVGVITDNRAGASSMIGAEHVAKSPADGYTLLCTATSFGTAPALMSNLSFDPEKSFAPVILLATSAVSLLVNPELPARSMPEFIALARKEPGKLYYSSPGNGTPQHLAMELLKQEVHIDLVHVPYKASGGAVSDLIAGHVQAMSVPLQTGAPYVHSGKLRMLAVMSAQRSSAFPDVPTLKELGLGDLVVETWYGMFAPAGTPAPVVAKLNAELNELLKQPEMRALLEKQGMNAEGGSPERFGALVRSEIARWARVVKAAGIKAD
jgi:tripartite-type tricarboxylate transporter receptor subunit TctC